MRRRLHARRTAGADPRDEEIIAELLRRPDLLTIALGRKPELIVLAIGAFPVQRRKIRSLLEQFDKREPGKPGNAGHPPEVRSLIRVLDQVYRDQGVPSALARRRKIVDYINAWPQIFDPVKLGGVAEILSPRKRK